MIKTLHAALTLANLNWAATTFLGHPAGQTDSATPPSKSNRRAGRV